MAVSLTHTTVAVGTEAGNGEIGKDEWNENHTITLATGKLLGRTTAGDGAVEEIDVSDFAAAAHNHDGDYAPLSHDHDSDYVELAGDTMTGTLTMDSGTNIALTNTTNANQFGVIIKGGNSFIHDFNYGNNGTVTTTGKNTFVGVGAGNLTTGSTATSASHSSNNTVVGNGAAAAITTANGCVAIGSGAFAGALDSNESVAIGYKAMDAGTSGKNYSVAIGSNALGALTSGGSCIGIGYFAGSGVTTGTIVAIGFSAGQSVTTASDNVCVGGYALNATTGTGNTALGSQAARYTTSGAYNIAFGNLALQYNTTGQKNVAIGYSALRYSTTSSQQTAIGENALYNSRQGTINFALGSSALYELYSGSYNSAGGGLAGRFLGQLATAGSFVTGVAYTIQSAGTTDFTLIGAANNNVGTVFTATGAGSGTGTASPNASYNTFYGAQSGYDATTGDNNIAIGYNTARGITTGTGNTVIGTNITGLSSTLTDNIILGSGSNSIRVQFDGSDWWFSGSIGYATGQGGAVTQATSRTTGVTLNKNCGAITLVSAAGSTSWQSFTVTNSEVAATDTIIVNQKSGTDKYMIHVTAVGAGSFEITYATTGGTTTEQPVFNFSVLKAVAA